MQEEKPIELLLDELDRQNKAIKDATVERERTIRSLRDALLSDNDWISVRRAAERVDISQSKIYERINDGRLSVRHIGAKKFVRRSEVDAIDDRYGA